MQTTIQEVFLKFDWNAAPREIGSEEIFQDEHEDHDAVLDSLLINDKQAAAYRCVKGNLRFFNPLLANSVPPVASFMMDTTGNFLFTPGVIHWVYGAPGSRKSFLSQTAVLDHAGVYIDAETNSIKIEMRTKVMGYQENDAHRFSCPQTVEDLNAVVSDILQFEPTIVVLDSCARLCGLMGLDPMDSQDIETLFDRVIRPLANVGHAVVVIDHLPKNTKSKDFAFGSMNKKAQADVSILVEDVAGMNYSTLTLQKDRMYTFGSRGIMVGQEFAALKLTSNPTRAVVDPLIGFDASGTPVLNKKDHRFKEVKDMIVKALQVSRTLSKTELNHRVGGKSETVTRARQELLTAGVIEMTQGKTANGGTAHLMKLTGKSWEFSKGRHLEDLRPQEKSHVFGANTIERFKEIPSN